MDLMKDKITITEFTVPEGRCIIDPPLEVTLRVDLVKEDPTKEGVDDVPWVIAHGDFDVSACVEVYDGCMEEVSQSIHSDLRFLWSEYVNATIPLNPRAQELADEMRARIQLVPSATP